jgi:hypothetical protein
MISLQRMDRHHFAWLSIAAAVSTIALKTLAWWITGSVGCCPTPSNPSSTWPAPPSPCG